MVRKQFFIDEEQNRRLKVLAVQTGKSVGEVIRESIAVRMAQLGEQADDWKLRLKELRGMWKDRDDLDAFYAERRQRERQRRDGMGRLMASDDTQ